MNLWEVLAVAACFLTAAACFAIEWIIRRQGWRNGITDHG